MNEADHQQSLERRLREMTELVESLRRRETELRDELQRQAARHEEERRRWHEECRLLQEQRDQLLRQRAARPSIARLFVSSRAIGAGSSKHGSGAHAHHHPGNRPRNFGSLSEGWKQQVLRVIRESGRNHLALNVQRRMAEAEAADQAARALDTLCISEPNKQSDKTNIESVASSPPVWPAESRISPALGEHRIGDLLKRRLMQQQLSSVVHAQNCNGPTCGVPGCSDTRKILEHMRSCTGCPTCSLTREAVWHYKNCGQDGCEICGPVKGESTSTQEHLVKFMEALCKDLDEDVSVEDRRVVDHPVVAGEFVSLDLVQPLLYAPILCPIPLPGVETPRTEDSTDMNVEAHE